MISIVCPFMGCQTSLAAGSRRWLPGIPMMHRLLGTGWGSLADLESFSKCAKYPMTGCSHDQRVWRGKIWSVRRPVPSLPGAPESVSNNRSKIGLHG